MAARYHFRLVGQGEVIEDDEGIFVESIEEAEREAMELIDEMRMQGEMSDPVQLWCLEIHDDDGRVLRSIQLF